MASPLQKPSIVNPQWKSVPPLDATEEDVKKYMERHFNDRSPHRRWELLRMAQNKWMYLGRQWINPPTRLRATGDGGYAFTEIERRSGAAFKRPVDNFIADGVDNIVGRLGRKEYEPSTRPTKNEPEIEAAARLAKDILVHDLEEMFWADKREEIDFNLVITGTAIARSLWDETATELSVLASPDAMVCRACGKKFASSKVPMQFAVMGQLPIANEMGTAQPFEHMDSLQEVEKVGERPQEVQMRHCPTCPEPQELQPHQPSVEEAQNETDVFGRPMGLSVPKGEGLIEIVSPFDWYPQNGGVGVEPHNMRMWGQKTVRDMEYIATHFPEWADKVAPEDPRELMRLDPILGDTSFSGPSALGDPDVYFNHAAVMELYVDPLPLPGHEKGHRFIRIGDNCKHDELMMPVDVEGSEPKEIPRVKYAAARCKRVPGRAFGRTPVDEAVPLQKRLNELDAMMVDIREKGMPRLFTPPGTEIFQHDDVEGALPVIEVECATQPGWNPKDGLFAGQPLNANVYLPERDAIVSSLRRVLGNPDITRGENPVGVKSGEHAQILAEEAAQKTNPLERSVKGMFEALFTHHLEVTWAFRKEDTEFQVQSDAGDFERDSYVGTDLLGQTKVAVEARGTFDKTLFQKQAVQEGIGAGLFNEAMATESGRAEIRELMGLPNVDTDKSMQVQRAEQAFREFVNNRKVPVIDPTLDDPWIHFQVLGKRWESDDALKLRREANWDQILPMLAGWDRKVIAASAQNDAQLAAYEGLDPKTWNATFAKASALAQKAMQPNPLPPPPQNGQFLPEAMEQRIMLTFSQMLPPGTLQPVPEGVDPNMVTGAAKQSAALLPLLQFYAVIQAYRLKDADNKAKAAMGAMQPSAPGGASTPAGTVPQPGQPVQPAPGTGGL